MKPHPATPPDRARSASTVLLARTLALALLGCASLGLLGAEPAVGDADVEYITLDNAALTVRVSEADGTLTVFDKRTRRTWMQEAIVPAAPGLARREGNTVRLEMSEKPAGRKWRAEIRLDAVLPELSMTVSGDGPLDGKVAFPHPFVTAGDTHLIVPLNEGISFPAADPAVPLLRLAGYSGHGLSMPFFGVTAGESAQLALIESPDDMAIQLGRHGPENTLYIAPEWEPQKQAWGYPRTIRYVFLDRGGFVAMCKYYRQTATAKGLVKTLAEKRRINPHVDLLVGAANIWCWETDPRPILDEMKALGMTRLLWSNGVAPATVTALNARGVLTSCYDNYKDVMDPATFPKLHRVSPNWSTAAWPQDIVIDAKGEWVRGWRVEGKGGVSHWTGNVCDLRSIDYARKRAAPDLQTRPLRARLLDTVTATTLFECYNPAHPMTRTDSKRGRLALLRYISQELGMVTGAENGMDFAVPDVHFFEGMMSLDNFRVPQSGRNMLKIWDTVPDDVARFQVGHRYRLPLWELVYHDCAVSYWYWGDYNNKLTPIWKKRDLFNALYGTPPMFLFTAETWAEDRRRFAKSYHDIIPAARAAGYAEMTDFKFLTPDRQVQQSFFANGVSVIVNFGDTPFTVAGGPVIPPLDFALRTPLQ